MCPRSGFRSEGTSERALVPVSVPGEHLNVFIPSFRGNIRQSHPFGNPPFPKGPFRTKHTTALKSVVFCYCRSFLLSVAKPQIFARKPKIFAETRRLASVTLGASPLARPYSCFGVPTRELNCLCLCPCYPRTIEFELQLPSSVAGVGVGRAVLWIGQR